MQSMVEGDCRQRRPVPKPPPVRPGGLPPPRAGEDEIQSFHAQ